MLLRLQQTLNYAMLHVRPSDRAIPVTCRHRTLTLTTLLALTPLAGVQAQSTTSIAPQFCPPDPLAGLIRPDTGADAGDPAINFTADEAASSPDAAELSGEVIVEQGDRRLEAPRVVLDKRTSRIRAEENVSYGDPRLAVRSERAELDLEQNTGVFDNAQYFIPERNAQGDAAQVRVNQDTQQGVLENVTYSTCERGDEFWELRTERLELDQAAGRGKARNITVAIEDIPVFYFPYLSFPINDERQSGFLSPRVGLDDDNGFDLRVPYYWNIAPNMDATFAPRIMTNRGIQLGAEYRFLYPRHQGEIDIEVLPDDSEYGDSREALYLSHQARPLDPVYTDLLYQYVSDDDYLDDLDNNLDLLNPSVLERHLNITYFGPQWTFLTRFQGFQTIDDDIFNETNEPYDRLPQLLFSGLWPDQAFGLTYDLQSELVYFDHDNKVTGARLDVQPAVSLPLQRPEGYLTPRASLRYTGYQLDNTDNTGIDNDSPSRSAPVLSVDSGLFFERPIDWGFFDLANGVQTLEPRLFYLYIPERDHDDIPLFDTTTIDRSYSFLFLENRFTGPDRLGDANQLTAAITTRLIDGDSGAERLRASLGQIYYFDDRQVTLNNTAPEDDTTSDFIGEAVVQISPALSLRSALQWDSEENTTERGAFDLRYQPGNGRIVNVAHRYAREDELEQVDFAVAWPISARWRTVGRFNYSLEEKRNLDLFAGVEYQDCCWALRMLARQDRDSPQDEEANNSLYLELELKGLAGVGSDINDLLEDAILGYESTRYR